MLQNFGVEIDRFNNATGAFDIKRIGGILPPIRQ